MCNINIIIAISLLTVYLTIGIPTLRRPKGDYFMATVDSLIGQSTEEQQQETTVVVILADRNSSFNEEVLQKLKVVEIFLSCFVCL